jgi:hypothetical protein
MEIGRQSHEEWLFHLASYVHPYLRFREGERSRGFMEVRWSPASDRTDATGEKVPQHQIPVALRKRLEGLQQEPRGPVGIILLRWHDNDPISVTISDTIDAVGSSLKSSRTHMSTGSGYRSMSPTTKKIEPRIAIRSGTSVPGSMAGITLTLENEAVRIFSR